MVGFLTRSHLALRLSFPVQQARRAFARLVCVTLAMLDDTEAIAKAISKLASSYKVALSRDYVSELLHALTYKDFWVIHSMGQ